MVTKRIHNRLHGAAGDGAPLGEAERGIYERTLRASAAQLASIVRSRDIVYCHDPQTAGLVSPLLETGATVVWRCHVGSICRTRPRARPGRSCAITSGRLTPMYSRAAPMPGRGSNERIWGCRRRSTRSRRRTRTWRRSRTSGSARGGRRRGDIRARRRLPGRVDRVAEIDQDAPVPADAPLVAQVSRRLDRSASCADSPSLPSRRSPPPARRAERRRGIRRPRGCRGGSSGRAPTPTRPGSPAAVVDCRSRRVRDPGGVVQKSPRLPSPVRAEPVIASRAGDPGPMLDGLASRRPRPGSAR